MKTWVSTSLPPCFPIAQNAAYWGANWGRRRGLFVVVRGRAKTVTMSTSQVDRLSVIGHVERASGMTSQFDSARISHRVRRHTHGPLTIVRIKAYLKVTSFCWRTTSIWPRERTLRGFFCARILP
jgi:hypothetical protein